MRLADAVLYRANDVGRDYVVLSGNMAQSILL
jgi:hypothetical protein